MAWLYCSLLDYCFTAVCNLFLNNIKKVSYRVERVVKLKLTYNLNVSIVQLKNAVAMRKNN